MGMLGLMGVRVGADGITGAAGVNGKGVGGRVMVSGRCGGASAEKLLVRSLTFESRAFST